MGKIFVHISSFVIVLVAAILPATASCSTDSSRNYSISWKLFRHKETDVNPAFFPYGECFRKAAAMYDIPPALLLAVARGESDFNPRAVSHKSCYGIMQIRWPATAQDLGFTSLEQLYAPCANIEAGARYLRMMLDRYDNDVHLALAAYNYGPGRIPKNSSAWTIPNGANKYSGYIYHHLQEVLEWEDAGHQHDYQPGDKIPVIRFDDPRRAKSFLGYFEQRAPEVPLDLFKTRKGETHIVLLAGSTSQTRRSIRRMKELGYAVDQQSIFK